ncbi:MAG: LamG-like jellyroll fold domain-containing protein [Verrucomicrobiales bacterium]
MEFSLGTDPTSSDSDFDGVSDSAEIAAGTDPLLRDTDGDGLSDGVELLVHFSDPLLVDSDGDGLDDAHEVIESGTNPLRQDTDGDGSGDMAEVRRGSDPNSASSVALARDGDILVYASLDSPELLGGGMLEMEWTPADGAVGGALCFAEGDSVVYGDGELGDPGAGSLSAILWFKLDSPAGERVLVSKGDGWGIEIESGNLSWRVDGVGEIELPGGGDAGNWHQAALVIDRGTGIVRAFYDGSEVGTLALEDDAVIDSPGVLSLARGGDAGVCLDDFSLLQFGMNALEIRALYEGGLVGLRATDVIGGGDMDLDGLNDEWELANFGDLAQTGSGDGDGDGLTNGEEQALGTDPRLADSDRDGVTDRDEILMGSDPLRPAAPSDLLEDLLVYSSFDSPTVTGSGSGARVFDLSVPAENGLVGGSITIVPGQVGGAARQTDGLVNYGDVHDPGTGSYSVSIWFQADQLGGEVIQRVVGKGLIDEDGASTGWQMMVFGEEVAVIGGTDDGGEWFLRGMPEGQARLRVGEWNHAVLTLDRGPLVGRVRLFVNGSEIAARRASDATLTPEAVVRDGAALITHGKSGGGSRFSGAVDELAIWGRAISPAEVARLYRGGLLFASLDDLTGSAGLEPEFDAAPEVVTVVLNPGETGTFDQVLSNAGDGRAQWFAELRFGEELTLETALERIDANPAGLLDPIPFRYAFTEGTSGSSIGDGGLDMFDGGNILGTDRASGIPYSNGRVIDSAAFGEDGAYFTRKLAGGLFVLGADLDGLEYFEVNGDLGADGIGTVDGTVLTVERSGRQFHAFVKRVYDGVDLNSGVFDPTVNHMIIIEDNGQAEHSFSTNTNSDQHRVTGLTGVRRLYHLLYSSQEGLRISDEDTLAIFETFIDTVGVAPGWLQLEGDSGQIEAGGEFRLGLNFDGESLGPGVEEAVIHLFSNDPENGEIDIPVRLRINAAPVAGEQLLVDVEEDNGPVNIDLGPLFEDDGATDGESLSYQLLSVSDPAILLASLGEIPGSELTLLLVENASGTSTARVRATDPQGLSVEQSITVRVSPVNDLPVARRTLRISVHEDSEPVVVQLRDYFTDVEDGPEGLRFSSGPPATGSLIGPPFLNRATGELRFGLVPNANGEVSIPLGVTDSDGGTLEADLLVTIFSVEDPPEIVGMIPDVIADAAANNSVVALTNYFTDPDQGDRLGFAIVGNTNPDLFSRLSVNRITGELEIVYAPFVSGLATLTVRAVDTMGNSIEQELRVELPEIDVPSVVIESAIRLNRQTGLWEQTVTISNVAQRAIGAVRLLVGGLAEGVRVHNASGQLPDGRAEIRYNQTLPVGESVSLVLEYYSSDRRQAVTPEVDVEVSLREEVLTAGEAFGIDRIRRMTDGSILVEFPAMPGRLYLVQYSSNLRQWKDALVRLRAGGTRVQWIDRGAPSTESAPFEAGAQRYYRVIELPE